MKLPNVQNAVIDIEKLRYYSLSSTHPKGKHKAKLFEEKLAMRADEAELLREAIRKAILSADAVELEPNAFGRRFRLDFELGRGKGIIWYNAGVRSGWIIRKNEDFPRLTTCYNFRKSA